MDTQVIKDLRNKVLQDFPRKQTTEEEIDSNPTKPKFALTASLDVVTKSNDRRENRVSLLWLV